MKKVLAIVLALVLVLSFAACGGTDVEPDGEDAALKVGFIYIGVINDGGFTQAHHEGTTAMEAHFDGAVETKYIEGVDDTDKQASLDAALSLIDQDCKVVVGTSYGFMDALDELANSGDYDDVVFLHFSGNKSNDSNFENYFGAIEDARYLSGMVAGSMTETNLLGYVGAHPYTEVNIGINAFTLGAQAVNPDVEVKVVYINSWYDPERERAAGDELIAAGCDVIAQHCDTTGPQVAASEGGGFAIGYNYPNNVAPDAFLTAPIWHHEVYLIDRVQKVLDGTFVPENYYGNMSDGYVALADMTDLVPADVQEMVMAKKAEIDSGAFAPFSGYIEYNDGTVMNEEGHSMTIAEIWQMTGLVKGAK
jgi:basic membrane protein A